MRSELATVEIPIARAENVISVLLSAVFHENDKRYVFIQDKSGWRRQEVELGISNLQHVEIVTGVPVDAVLVVAHLNFGAEIMTESEIIYRLASIRRISSR